MQTMAPTGADVMAWRDTLFSTMSRLEALEAYSPYQEELAQLRDQIEVVRVRLVELEADGLTPPPPISPLHQQPAPTAEGECTAGGEFMEDWLVS